MRIALLQLNQIVADLIGNAARIRTGVMEAQNTVQIWLSRQNWQSWVIRRVICSFSET